VFAVPKISWKKFTTYTKRHGLTDSKKLIAVQREQWYAYFIDQAKKNSCLFSVVSGTAGSIDVKGISVVIKKLIERALLNLNLDPQSVTIKLDGSLHAPAHFQDQETIIKGDSKHMAIAAASVMAKVTRDRYMVQQAKKYPHYAFDEHKGYGTKKHQEAIHKHGFCPLHRKTFCTRIRAKIDIA